MRVNKLLIVLIAFLAGCGQISIEPISTAAPTNPVESPTVFVTTTALPTEQVNATATITIPSATSVPPTATIAQQVPATLAPSTPTTGTGTEQTVKIVLIALEDNGQSGTLVGCGDSAIPINVTTPPTQGVLRAALEKLLSAKQQFYGESGYYNALYQSDLRVASVTIEQGKAIIRLTGSLMLGGTCDAPRVEAQLEQTALQFSTVNDVAVFINDVPLEDALSTR